MDLAELCLPWQKRGGAVGAAARFVSRHRAGLLLLWDVVTFAVVGLNSFILLLYKYKANRGLKYVICTGTVAYLLVLLFQAVTLRKHTGRRKILLNTKRIFRLVYTAIYLTAIMIDMLAMAKMPGNEWRLSYNGFLFAWVVLWGTNFLWIGQVYRFARRRLMNLARRKKEHPPAAEQGGAGKETWIPRQGKANQNGKKFDDRRVSDWDTGERY